MSLNVLVCYHSAEGQTAKVAERIASVLTSGGCTVELAMAERNPTTAGFDGVIVGDSIHLGAHSRELRRWITHHGDELDRLPTALFQVSLTSATDDDEHTRQAHHLMHQLLDATGLDPDVVGLFAGALAYTRYGWFKRALMRRVAASEGTDTDTSRDHEYTDWDAVDHFAADALALFGAPVPES